LLSHFSIFIQITQENPDLWKIYGFFCQLCPFSAPKARFHAKNHLLPFFVLKKYKISIIIMFLVFFDELKI